jgi:6-pyruvoyltetrahydropterin/6-carboxytetrahydropterin synthase
LLLLPRLGLLLLLFAALCTLSAAASAATTPALRALLIAARLLLLLRLLLRLRAAFGTLLPLLAALGVRLLLALVAITSALLPLRLRLPFAVALARPRTLALSALVPPRLRGARPLLPLPHLLLHETALLRLRAIARLIPAAVRAALPAFRVCLPAMRADDALWQRHVEIGAHCTLRRVPEDARRKTLETLIALAEGSSPNDCWDDSRAEDLLRSQSNAEEVRSLGMSEQMIERIFGEGHGAAAPTAISEARSTKHEARIPKREARSPRYVVRVEARFEAAHYLREYRGISEPLHGHSYKVEAELAARGGGVDNDAIAVDFVSAKRKLEALAKKLDYGCINDVAPFDTINPSAENIAEWFHRELSAAVADENAVVTAVTIWEGPVNSVRYEQAR